MTVDTLRCDCGSADLIAVAPGDAGERAPGKITTRRPKPDRCWCAKCWPWRKAGAA